MAYQIQLPDGSLGWIDDSVPQSKALEVAKRVYPDAFPAPPGIGQQILGLPAEIGKGFVRGLTVDPISGAASTVYTGARAAGADLTPFEKTAFGKGLASAQTALAPSDEGLVTQFGSGLGSLLSFIPGGLLKGGIGLATKLGQAGGVGAEEARSRAEQARLEGQADATAGQEFASQLGGGVVGFSELAPVRLLTKPIEQILRGVPKSQADLIAPGLFNSAKRMVATGGVEGLQEGMANIAQDLIAKGIYNPNLEVGESALGDAAMGASIGAFAQGAIELATRGKRGQLYEQLKTQERLKEEAEQQRIAQQQQAVIAAQEQEKMGQAMGALGATPQIDPTTGKPVLLLGAPAKEVNLQDPLGIRFDANDLSPKVVNDINKARKERGLPAIDQFTVEDLYDLAPNKNAISELLGRKIGYDESVSVTPRNIFDIAVSKNIDVQDPGFAEFLTRTTGTPDIRRMTPQQLFAAQQSISALPDFTELTKLPTGSIATVFDEKTYNKTINDLKKTVLNTGPLGKEATVQEIMDFSGLTKPQDAERLLQTAIQRGDLSASPTRGTVGTSINISVPFVPKSVVPGPDIRRGDFMESENVGYDIVSEDGTFKQFRPTLGAAEDLVAKANQNRETKVARIAGEIDRVSSGIELDKQRLGQLQEVGEEGSAEYKRLQAKIQKQEVNLGNLNSKIQSVSQPLQIKAKDKPRSRTGYTLFDNGKPIGTYPTKEDADIAAIQSLSDEQLDGVINAAPRSDVEGALEEPFGKQQLPTGTIRGATPRRLYIEATREKERRFRQQAGLPPLAAPVEIKITGDAQAAAEKLRAIGLTVRFMPEVEKEVPEINKRLRAILDKLGLQEVRLNIIESLSVKGFIIDGPDGKPMAFYPQPQAGTPKFKEVMAVLKDAKAKGLNVREGVSSANGSYVAQLIEIALDSANPIRATRHEALHALRDLGFFTKEQWSVLENKAKSEWMKKYNIAQRYGGLDYDSQIEEAVADAFSDFDQTQPPAGLVGVLFRKIKTFFEALGNAFRGSGFQTAADVFTRVEEGGLTRPDASVAGEKKYSLEAKEAMLEARRAAAGKFNQIDPPQSLIDLYRRVQVADEQVSVGGYSRAKTAATKLGNRLNREMTVFARQALGREPKYIDIGELSSRLNQFVDPDFIGENKYSLKAPEFEQTADVTPLGIQQARIYEKELEALIKKIGDRIVGMKSGETLDNVRKAVKKLQSYTAQGLKGKEWYENSAKAVLDGFNGDPVLAEKFFQIIAITSANTEVSANFTKASKAWEQFATGKPIKVGTGNENKKIDALLNFGEDWEGRKTNTFYTNLMEAMDGKDSGRSTIDLHMTRMLFDKDAPTDAQYILAENMVRLLASKIGIPARQVQAASWVTQKAKSIFDDYRKKGWKKNLNDDQLREFAFERAVTDYSHLMKARIKKLPVSEAMKELSSNIRSRVQNITGEVIPSVKTEMSEVEQLAFKNKEKLTKKIAKSDMIQNIANNLGITSKVRITVGSGAYAGKVNPNLIVQVVNDDPVVAQQDSLDLANAMSYVFKQDSTPFFRADPALLEQDQLGYGFKFASPLTPAQQKNILSFLTNKFGENVGFTKVRANEIVIINYRGADGTPFLASDTDFIIGLDEVRNDINSISPIESQEVFGAQSEYPYHEWETEPTGISIIQGIQDRRPQLPNIQRGLDNLRESFVADVRQSIRETGQEPKFSLRSDELIGRSGIGGGVSIREQQPSAQSYDAVHYGKQRVNNLAGSMYGTGIKGAETQRLSESDDPRIRERAYFYIPYSNGRMPMPEAGLGNEVHIQRLNNLLGPSPEAQALSRAARTPDGQFDANAFESSVIDAGYDGYAIPDMGMAVVLGADVPVQPRGTRQEIEERTEKDKIQIGDRKYSLRSPETPEFKKWFGNSKVVDDNGKPLLMYHGTPSFEGYVFKPFETKNRAGNIDGYYFTSSVDDANDYAGLEEGAEVIPAYLSIKNPYVPGESPVTKAMRDQYFKEMVAANKHMSDERAKEYAQSKMYYLDRNGIPLINAIGNDGSAFQRIIKAGGYDGYQDGIGSRHFVAFESNQVKSAIGNVGTFARDNNDIRYSIALGAIEPSTSLIPDVGGNPNGILGFMPDRLGGKPIRMLVGTHNDLVPELDNERMRRPQSYGANHILNRVLSDPSRIPGGAEELLEKIVKTAQTTAQKYNRIFKEGNMFIIYDGRNSLIVSPEEDAMSIVTMYVQNQPERRYGNAVFSGRAPSMPQEFVEPIRGMDVVAGEGRVQIKPSEVKVIKPSKVLEVSPVTEMAPTKAGKISIKKPVNKYSLALPKESVDDFFATTERLEEPEGVQIIRENWIGGVAGIGDRDSAYNLKRVYGGPEYIQSVQDLIRENFGDSFKGYRLMSQDELSELESGAMGTQLASFTLDPMVGLRFSSLPMYARKPKGELVVVEMDLTPEHVQMIGHIPEKEIVIDYGVGYNTEEINAYASPYKAEKFSIRDEFKPVDTSAPKFKKFYQNSVLVDESGNPIVLYHGTTKDIESFKVGKEGGSLGNGIYLTPSQDFADEYAKEEGGNVIPVYAHITNPLIIDGSISRDPMIEALVKLGVDRDKADQIVEKAYEDKGYITNEVKSRATKQGFDGILQYKDGNLTELVAFSPNQIKSAVSNTGEFDPSDKRIQYSLVEPIDTDTAQRIPQNTFNVDPNTSRDNLIYLLQNKQIDLKRVIDGIRSAGKDIADKWNAYLKEELFHGRSATRIKFFMDRELQPLLKKMESAGISLDQMDEYLLARHAPEANSYIRSINPDPNANAGMSDQEAANYMNSLPAPRRAALERIAKDVDAITKGTRQLMVDYGLEDQKTIDTWERTYKKYVPLFREETEGNPISTGRGYQIRGSTTKRRMGSTRSVVDVLANIAMQREKTIVRGEKNRVGNSLYGLVLTNPNKGFWGVIDPGKVNRQTLRNELIGLGIDSAEADQMINEMSSRPYQKTIDKATGLVVQRIPPSWAKAENIFVTRINGQDRFIGFNKNDERAMRMATTLKNLDAQQQAEAIKMMGTAGAYYSGTINAVGKATRFFASVNTQYNPAFGIYNLMRDIGGAVLNLQSTPLKGNERKIISDALGLIKDIYSDLRRQRQGLPANSKSAQIFEEFELEGGKTGYRDLFEDSQSRAEQLQKDLEDFKSGKPLKGKGKAVMRWLSDFNDSIENAIRVSVYKNAIDKGISKERAASLAKNITVNFNRTGAMSRNFQTLYAFFNASVQGTTRIAETLFTPDGKLSPTGKKIVMGGITLGLMQAVLLAMAGLDDDEVPDFVKDKSFIIPYGDGKYLAVPMPLGYNIIPGFGRRVMEFAMSDDKNVGKSVFETANMIIDGFNPLGSATFVQTLAPTIADPIVALAENKDFTGKPIAREDVNSLVPTPGYTRKSQNASAITEALAYGINLMSGGTEFKQGVISPTPDQIEYLVGQVFGGVGREAMKVGRGLEALATGEELATYNIPIAGRLVGNIQQKAAQTGRFYDNIKALNEHQAEIEGRMARGEDITEYVNDNPEAMLYQLGDKTYSKISKLRQLKKTLEESGASRDQTKAIDDAMLNLMISLNMSYNSARQQ